MKADLISVVEAAYQIEQSEDAWLRGVLGAARPSVDAEFGAISCTYDASNPAALRFNSFVSTGLSDESAAHIARNVPLADSDFIQRAFLSTSCGTSRDVLGWKQQSGVETARGAARVSFADHLRQ